MSQENVEVVRRIVEEGTIDRAVEQLLDIWEPHGDYYPVQELPESRPCHGVEEIAQFFSDFQQAWERFEISVKAITPVRDDRVLLSATLAAEGRESGVKLQQELFACYWLRHGRVFREEDHFTLPGALHALGLHGDTLEAAGLSEQAMSQENVEVVRRIYEAFNRRDWDGAFRDQHPDTELTLPRGPSGGTYRGRDEVQGYWESLLTPFEAFTAEPERLFESGDQVVVFLKARARPKGSSAEIENRTGHLWTIRDGKALSMRLFAKPEEALEAAGLSE